MTCPSCAATFPGGASMCPECGALVAQPAAGAQAAVAGAASWSGADRSPFLFAGRWWTRGPAGEVRTYDEGAGEWLRTPDAMTPFFMRRPRFTSLRTPAITLYILFGLQALALVLAVVASVDRAQLLGDLAGDRFVAFDDLEASDTLTGTALSLTSLGNLAIAGVFIWWTRRAVCNSRALGAADSEFSPGWSVGWWFIPFANFVQPLRAINQAWAAADPSLPPAESRAYRRAPRSWLILAWWLTYNLATAAWSVLFSRAEDDTSSFAARGDAMYGVAAAQLALLVAAGLAVAVVARMTRRQDAANRKFDLPGGLAAVPGDEPVPYAVPAAAPATGW
ncbi:MAG: DUF4328 domain-containing protein [Dehalococcoidia bacterium]|nr:DUF4328 domain-containing protein [Dehalococcoidia bacterium]